MLGPIDPLTLVALLAVGLVAATLTTVAGFGGGMILALVLSLRFGPQQALALTAPTLAVGHVHRVILYRREVDGPVAWRFVAGAVPGALVGATLAMAIPDAVLTWMLVGGAVLGVLHVLGALPERLGQRVIVPGGATIGLLASTSGGGGPLLPPVLLSSGVHGRGFVATAAVGALAIHATRIVVYATGGWLGLPALAAVLVLMLGLLGGNLLGARIASHLSDDHQGHVTRVAMVAVLGLALVQAVA